MDAFDTWLTGLHWAAFGFFYGWIGVVLTSFAMWRADRSTNHYQANLIILFMSLFAVAHFGMHLKGS